MKKIISLVLTAAMLITAMVIAPATSSAATLDSQNVGINAYYFGGTLKFTERTGRPGSIVTAATRTIKTGDPAKGTIDLDGVISSGEWGDPNISISSTYAANNNGKDGVKNNLFETASAENSYYYYKYGTSPKTIGFTAYFLWDESYFYVAAHVVDPDNHLSTKSGKNAWNGDAFQFRVDYQGPNSAHNGIGYDATNNTYPWAGSIRSGNGTETYAKVGNFVFTYTTANNGYTECWDAAHRWNVTTDETTGNLTGVEHGIDYMGYAANPAYAVVYPRTEGTSTNPVYVTEYEIAIPWGLIDSLYEPSGFTASAGKELGMSIALLNGAKGETEYNSYLEWGNGVCGSRTNFDPQTCGGSNSVTLSATAYSAFDGCQHTFNAPTCENPYVCSICGYKKGFKAGHTYNYSKVSLPTETTPGSITATCSVCGSTYTNSIGASTPSVKHSLKTTDTTFIDKGFYDGWTVNWKDPEGKTLFNPDGTAKTSFDTQTFGYAVADCATNGSIINPACASMTYMDQTTTYFPSDSDVGLSYTSKMDIYITEFQDRYATYVPGVFYQFAGKAVDYMAGLFKLEGKYYFAIISAAAGTSLIDFSGNILMTAAQFQQRALSCTQVSAETVAFNTWHQFIFVHDDASATALLYWDGALVAGATDPHLKYDNDGASSVFRRYNVGYYAKDIEVGSVGLASQYIPVGHTLTINYKAMENGAVVDKVSTAQVAEGTAINATTLANYMRDGAYVNRFSGWTGNTECLADATYACGGTTTGTMPASDVTITANYVMVADIYVDGSWNGKDGNMMTQIVSGTATPTLAADINFDGSWNGKDGNLMLQIVNGTYVPTK